MKWLGGVIQCVYAPRGDDAEAREASSQGKGKKARAKTLRREEFDMAETGGLTLDEVYEALRDVYDPEIPVNIVDLGLVRDVSVVDGNIDMQMTLTFAGCGMGPYIAQQAEWRLAELEGVEDINVDLVFDPPWTPEEITEEGKKLLGLD